MGKCERAAEVILKQRNRPMWQSIDRMARVVAYTLYAVNN